MSTIEIAIRRVKGLSPSRARALLAWLETQEGINPAGHRRAQAAQSSGAARTASRRLMAWYDSVRGTVDWDPPKMPPDAVLRASL